MKIKNMVKRVRKALAGFSLVEMLIVIAVIGVITAIAVPAISSITGEAETAKIQRNAQNIASVFNSAIAAGSAITTASVTAAIDALQTGTTGSGAFANATFQVDISDAEQTLVEGASYLSMSGNGVMSLGL